MNQEQSTKRIIETALDESAEGVRLDVYLARRFTYNSRTSWQTLIENGAMKLNGNSTRPSRILHAGELLTFEPPEEILREPEIDPRFKILLETNDYIAVSKSGNLPVHPAGRYFANTLLEIMRKDYGKLFVVNRLDRETSGIVMLAKSAAASSRLAGLFSDRKTVKHYTCFVHGHFQEITLDASGFLSHDASSAVNKKRRFTKEIPPATEYETCRTEFTLEAYSGTYSRLDCLLHTGRLHQIRATLCSLGFPVVGDKLYGVDDSMYLRQAQGALTEDDMQRLVLPRQALHAKSLAFKSPFDGMETRIEAPLPPDMEGII